MNMQLMDHVTLWRRCRKCSFDHRI